MNMINNISKKFDDYLKKIQNDLARNKSNVAWDDTKDEYNKADKNVTASGKYSNHNLPLDFDEKINRIKQTLKIFDESLPSLKK